MSHQSLAHKSVYWLKVISLGLLLGLGIQFAKAWTNPAAAPPGGSVSGPITNGVVAQYKTGKLGVNMSSAPVSYGLQVGGDAGVTGNTYLTGSLVIAGLANCDLKTNGSGAFYCGTDATGGGADNLGNHSATTTLNMNGNSISNGGSIAATTICLSGDCKSAWPTAGSEGIVSITGGSCGVGQVVKSITAAGVVSCGNAVSGGSICGLYTETAWAGAQTQTVFPCMGVINSRIGAHIHNCPPGYSFKYLDFKAPIEDGSPYYPDNRFWSCVGQ